MKCPGCRHEEDHGLILSIEGTKVKVNGGWLYHLHATHGLPPEISLMLLEDKLEKAREV